MVVIKYNIYEIDIVFEWYLIDMNKIICIMIMVSVKYKI